MKRAPLLFLNVLIVATCGLIYELLAGTIASYVLGDSVTQFSLIIGIYLFAMGVGSWLSRFIDKGLASRFVDIELAVAVLGGFSAPVLFLAFSRVSYFYAVLTPLFCIGACGPRVLLLRILKIRSNLRTGFSSFGIRLHWRPVGFNSVSHSLVPRLGLIRTRWCFTLTKWLLWNLAAPAFIYGSIVGYGYGQASSWPPANRFDQGE